jgi:hypothetical protein
MLLGVLAEYLCHWPPEAEVLDVPLTGETGMLTVQIIHDKIILFTSLATG